MVRIGKRSPALHLKHPPHPVDRASCPATRQLVIGQTPQQVLTYTPILQYFNRRGRSQAIIDRPDAQLSAHHLSPINCNYNKSPRNERLSVPTDQRLRIHGSITSGDTPDRRRFIAYFLKTHNELCDY